MPDGTVAGAQAEGAEIPGRQPGAALVEGEYFFSCSLRALSAAFNAPGIGQLSLTRPEGFIE